MSHHPLKILMISEKESSDFWGERDFSPPKDPLDLVRFQDYLASGSYVLPEHKIMEVNACAPSPQKSFFTKADPPTVKVKENTSKCELNESDLLSVAESLATGTQTVVTTCPNSTYGSESSSILRKRNPKAAENFGWKMKNFNEWNQSLWTVSHSPEEKDLFLDSIFGKDIANYRVVQLSIRIIDGAGPILSREWSILSDEDRILLATYLAQVFGQKPQNIPDLTTPQLLNSLLSIKLKSRRNEERLNKTVKRVNYLMAQSFANLNKIELQADSLASLMQNAYFAKANLKLEVFAQNTGFSQKSFGEAVKNTRYAEDFEAVLKKSYIPEMVASRRHRVLKEIRSIRKALQEGHDPISQIDHNKHAPWLLEDIVEGAKLCQNIIERQKVG